MLTKSLDQQNHLNGYLKQNESSQHFSEKDQEIQQKINEESQDNNIKILEDFVNDLKDQEKEYYLYKIQKVVLNIKENYNSKLSKIIDQNMELQQYNMQLIQQNANLKTQLESISFQQQNLESKQIQCNNQGTQTKQLNCSNNDCIKKSKQLYRLRMSQIIVFNDIYESSQREKQISIKYKDLDLKCRELFKRNMILENYCQQYKNQIQKIKVDNIQLNEKIMGFQVEINHLNTKANLSQHNSEEQDRNIKILFGQKLQIQKQSMIAQLKELSSLFSEKHQLKQQLIKFQSSELFQKANEQLRLQEYILNEEIIQHSNKQQQEDTIKFTLLRKKKQDEINNEIMVTQSDVRRSYDIILRIGHSIVDISMFFIKVLASTVMSISKNSHYNAKYKQYLKEKISIAQEFQNSLKKQSINLKKDLLEQEQGITNIGKNIVKPAIDILYEAIFNHIINFFFKDPRELNNDFLKFTDEIKSINQKYIIDQNLFLFTSQIDELNNKCFEKDNKLINLKQILDIQDLYTQFQDHTDLKKKLDEFLDQQLDRQVKHTKSHYRFRSLGNDIIKDIIKQNNKQNEYKLNS